MKKWVQFILSVPCIAYLLWMLLPQKPKTELNGIAFGKLPILANGRVKPLDTLARNSLMMISGKQIYRNEDRKAVSAIDWLMEVFFRPDLADGRKVFLVHNPEVLGLFGWEQKKEKYFSFSEFKPFLSEVEKQSKLAEEVEAPNRSLFQREILKLFNRLILYHRLKNSLHTADAKQFYQEIGAFQKALVAGAEELTKKQKGETFSQQTLDDLRDFTQRYDFLIQTAYFRAIPPPRGDSDPDHWKTVGQCMLDIIQGGTVPSPLTAYARMDEAYRNQDGKMFQQYVRDYQTELTSTFGLTLNKTDFEVLFNRFEPFYQCMILYVLVFVLVWFSWLKWPEFFGGSAFWILVLTFLIHTWGLWTRMYLQGRPPVTNLYSSAIFIGWGAVLLGVILEKLYKNGIGNITASAMGFLTLLIAHHLSGEGDTMEMMRAVLDSNFWLATHVVVVTLGYSSTFLAGFLAILFFILCWINFLDEKRAKNLSSMVYGIVCFSTLFSLTGTILGGIWADQSWGRFWGWDPKENGALLIVIWNAIILHARWGGMIKQRGLMVMAIFGNIVTSFSWFGVNMLGIGLHSYGFMDSAFKWLIAFDLSQLAIMSAGLYFPLKLQETTDSKHRK